ncbi:hypothetical protein GGX14DRAFT_578357 [Mycena pura]|uniref:Uncharacterized protein n=1 Tax=Mycena pura TaxID=153505 RepID=A0AAD6UQ69_9AGAR|nr:hypothetical protein GGX14DRAFT_578357 [Mycena pura]
MTKRKLKNTKKKHQGDVSLTQEEVPLDVQVTDNSNHVTLNPVTPSLHDPGPQSPSAAVEVDVGNVSEADDLEEYGGPQLTHLVDTAVKVVKRTLDLPTFKPYTTIVMQDLNLVSRQHVALELGATAFSKPFLRDPKPVSRKLRVGTFRNELANLQSVITSVEVAQLVDEGGQVYRLQKGPYWTLWKQLDELRKRSKDAFDVFNLPMPAMPTWGRSEDPLAFYMANEYEILGICYRAEVENYLVTLDEYFDFATNEARPPDEEVEQYYDEYRRSISAPPQKSNVTPHLLLYRIQ